MRQQSVPPLRGRMQYGAKEEHYRDLFLASSQKYAGQDLNHLLKCLSRQGCNIHSCGTLLLKCVLNRTMDISDILPRALTRKVTRSRSALPIPLPFHLPEVQTCIEALQDNKSYDSVQDRQTYE